MIQGPRYPGWKERYVDIQGYVTLVTLVTPFYRRHTFNTEFEALLKFELGSQGDNYIGLVSFVTGLQICRTGETVLYSCHICTGKLTHHSTPIHLKPHVYLMQKITHAPVVKLIRKNSNFKIFFPRFCLDLKFNCTLSSGYIPVILVLTSLKFSLAVDEAKFLFLAS